VVRAVSKVKPASRDQLYRMSEKPESMLHLCFGLVVDLH